ncbi:AraC family transcriptional regulator [Pectinatus haikarae]|uniref:AraC-like DNA-binding protein n=1 Tax=Pectinatus haikarae TaxID=349096 RepID=A0ABT9Y8G6_9FIRM|nr:AraC family transcriptional regulator [Pectinatus haikarae]MDQ0204142.1 AraC-like DNA-binding protein [Pectinatus haikarae]
MKKNFPFNEDHIELKNSFYVDENYSEKHVHMIHSHENVLELLYIYSGEGRYFVRDREYAVHSGDLMICNAGVLHGESPLQKHTMQTYCCAFSGLETESDKKLLAYEEKPLFSLPAEKSECFNALMPIIYNVFSGSKITAHYLSMGLLSMACEEILTRMTARTALYEQKNENLVRKITAYIDKNYKESISLEKISRDLYISPSRLSHVFKEETGLSPIQYAIHRRIGEAQSLLVETDEPICFIEESLGFCSSVHFSMMFKKHVGISPKAYRQHFCK